MTHDLYLAALVAFSEIDPVVMDARIALSDRIRAGTYGTAPAWNMLRNPDYALQDHGFPRFARAPEHRVTRAPLRAWKKETGVFARTPGYAERRLIRRAKARQLVEAARTKDGFNLLKGQAA